MRLYLTAARGSRFCLRAIRPPLTDRIPYDKEAELQRCESTYTTRVTLLSTLYEFLKTSFFDYGRVTEVWQRPGLLRAMKESEARKCITNIAPRRGPGTCWPNVLGVRVLARVRQRTDYRQAARRDIGAVTGFWRT